MSERILGRPRIVEADAPPYRSHEIHARGFTVRQCERILALGADREPEVATLEAAAADGVDEGIRRSRTAWLPPEEATWWIYDRLAGIAERANRRYRFELTGFDEDLQLTYYDGPGDHYGWHQDGLDGQVATRKLSIVVQLSPPDDYAGGELELFDQAEDLDPEEYDAFVAAGSARGAAVVFPAFEYHRVRPIRRGRRVSLVAWVSGPPFR